MSKKSKELMKKLESILFPVKKVSAEEFYKTKNVEYLPGLNHVIVVTLPDGKEMVVNSCSENYELVSNRELLEPFINKITDEHDLDVVDVKMWTHSKFHVGFSEPGEGFDMNAGNTRKRAVVDKIVPLVRYNNSYDGQVKYSYEAGFWRYTCSNGAKIPHGTISKDIVMHTPGAVTRVEQSVKKMEEFIMKAKEAVLGYAPLIELDMSKSDALKRIEEVTEDLGLPKQNMETAVGQLEKEIGMGLPINDWLVYNAINYGLYKTPESMLLTHKADKLDHEVLNYLITQ